MEYHKNFLVHTKNIANTVNDMLVRRISTNYVKNLSAFAIRGNMRERRTLFIHNVLIDIFKQDIFPRSDNVTLNYLKN